MKRSELLRDFKSKTNRVESLKTEIAELQEELGSIADKVREDHELVDLLMGDGVKDYDDTLFVMDKGDLNLTVVAGGLIVLAKEASDDWPDR